MMGKYKSYEKYKDSCIAWLGEIPVHWDIQKAKWIFKKEKREILEEDDVITAFRDGQVTLRKKRRVDGFTIAIQEHGYQGIRKGDLVIHGMDAFAGAIGVSDSDGKASPVYNACTLRNEGEIWYFCWIVRQMSKSGFIESLAKGIRERSTDFRFDVFSKQLLPVPTAEEQTAIVCFLDYKLAKINRFILKKKQLIKLLNERIITAIQKTSEPDNLNDKFWPHLSSKWNLEKAKRVFLEINIKNHPEKELLAVTQNRGILPKRLCEENFVIPTTGIDSQKLVEIGDFVISLRSFQGGIEYSDYKGLVSPAYTIIRLKPEYQDPTVILFYKYLFKSKQFINLLNTAISGIRDGKNVSWGDFSELQIPVPNVDDLDFLPEMVKTYESQKAIFEREEKIVTEYKIALIDKAVTGKIDVRGYKIPELESVEESYKEIEEELSMEAADVADYQTEETE